MKRQKKTLPSSFLSDPLEVKRHHHLLKNMINNGQQPVEKKSKEIDTVCNYKRLIFCSGDAWAVPCADDRRYIIFDV